ncbi:hypothetical protein MRX96_011746 [Rhipicephalus microplus]
MLQEAQAPALQPDNKPTAVAEGMKIQVAEGQPIDKPLTVEKRQVKRQRLTKPRASKSRRGASPRLSMSPSSSIPYTQNDDSVVVWNKAPSPRRPHSTPLTAGELLVSYEKLHDMVQSRSQETVTKPTLTRSMVKSIVPGKIASVIVTVALCVLLLGSLFLLTTRRSVIRLKLCRTEDCQRHATLLTEYLNTTLDPCDDFEAYVCSAWQISKEYREQAKVGHGRPPVHLVPALRTHPDCRQSQVFRG